MGKTDRIIVFLAVIATVAALAILISQPAGPAQTDISMTERLNMILAEYPAELVDLGPNRNLATIRIHGYLTRGGDYDCQRAAELFYGITSLGLTLHVLGEWVPSRINPMDHAWTRVLMAEADRMFHEIDRTEDDPEYDYDAFFQKLEKMQQREAGDK